MRGAGDSDGAIRWRAGGRKTTRTRRPFPGWSTACVARSGPGAAGGDGCSKFWRLNYPVNYRPRRAVGGGPGAWYICRPVAPSNKRVHDRAAVCTGRPFRFPLPDSPAQQFQYRSTSAELSAFLPPPRPNPLYSYSIEFAVRTATHTSPGVWRLPASYFHCCFLACIFRYLH